MTTTTTKQFHFLDITPLNQLQLLSIVTMNTEEPLLINYGSSVLSAYRRRVCLIVCPFSENRMEIDEYYKLRGCLDLTSLWDRAERLLKSSPLSFVTQSRLVEWLEDILIKCVDACPWTPELQVALDLFIAKNK
jgi:hypothetical protein